MALKVTSDVTRRRHPRPRTVLNPTGRIGIVGGIFLFFNYKLLEFQESLLEKKLAQVQKRQNEIEAQLKEFALNLVKDFLANI